MRKRWWRRRESNPRPKWFSEASLRAYPAFDLGAAFRTGAEAQRPAWLISGLGLRRRPAPKPALMTLPGSRQAGYRSAAALIRQRRQTADWQFWFSDRFTGARNPARLTSSIPSRRSRFAPFLAVGLAAQVCNNPILKDTAEPRPVPSFCAPPGRLQRDRECRMGLNRTASAQRQESCGCRRGSCGRGEPPAGRLHRSRRCGAECRPGSRGQARHMASEGGKPDQSPGRECRARPKQRDAGATGTGA